MRHPRILADEHRHIADITAHPVVEHLRFGARIGVVLRDGRFGGVAARIGIKQFIGWQIEH